MTGPIFVEGAEPGDVARGEDRRLRVPASRTASAASSPAAARCPTSFPYVGFHLVRFDPRAGTAAFAPGITLKLAPFFGSIGVAPNPLVGRISSGPPGPHAGNLDNKELVAGSTLYIPVHVPGALLSIGDGHAMQGDGEATLTALETSLRGTVQITVRKGMHLKWPRGETPTHYIAMGLHTDLDEAAKLAVQGDDRFPRDRKEDEPRRGLHPLLGRGRPARHAAGGRHQGRARDARQVDVRPVVSGFLVRRSRDAAKAEAGPGVAARAIVRIRGLTDYTDYADRDVRRRPRKRPTGAKRTA